MQLQTPVLIIGGGPVGLATALDLSWRGVRSMLLEVDERTAPVVLAKAGTLNARTLEFCRRWGIADRVAHWGAPDDYPRDTVYCTALDGLPVGRDPSPSQRERRPAPYSPEMLQKCPQHVFDPLLAETVRSHGLCDLRYSTRLLAFDQDARGVTADIEDLVTGKRSRVRAQYLVGCDGAASQVRTTLGVPFEGATLDYSVSAMLRIQHLERYHAFGRAERFMFMGRQGTWCNMTSVDFQDLWRLTLVGSEERLDPARLDMQAVLRQVFGELRIPCEILRMAPWRRSQCTAGHYVQGRVVLAGDSAHTTSPTGGHGLNTGLGDVFGLGWMLQALVEGWGGPGLLAGYEAERRPVAIRNGQSSTRNYRGWVNRDAYYQLIDVPGPEGDAARAAIGRQLSELLYPEWNSDGVGLGYRYEGSPLIVPDGTPQPADAPSEYVPTARPGHRAPHVCLKDGRSTLDLFGRGFVLLQLESRSQAADALLAAAKERGVPVQVVPLDEPAVRHAYGQPWVLVRPDGHVGWRGSSLPPDAGTLIDTLAGRRAELQEKQP